VPSVIMPQWPDGRRNALALARRGLATDIGSCCHPGDVVRAVDDALCDDALRDRLRRVRDAMRAERDPTSVLLARLEHAGASW
jgi:UDP:flavonoid glycosyltransferase YjiC (YdhE family)